MPSTTKKGMWTDEALELTMDVVENGTYSLWRARRAWNIPMSSIFYHLNGKTKSKKMGPKGVPTEEEDVAVIAWTLTMEGCGLLISKQQLNMQVAKLTQTRATPFWDGIPSNSWWHWFKHRHPKVNIIHIGGLQSTRADTQLLQLFL
jgi:hypothetical protein